MAITAIRPEGDDPLRNQAIIQSTAGSRVSLADNPLLVRTKHAQTAEPEKLTPDQFWRSLNAIIRTGLNAAWGIRYYGMELPLSKLPEPYCEMLQPYEAMKAARSHMSLRLAQLGDGSAGSGFAAETQILSLVAHSAVRAIAEGQVKSANQLAGEMDDFFKPRIPDVYQNPPIP